MTNEKIRIQNNLPLQSSTDFQNHQVEYSSKANVNNNKISSYTNLKMKTRIL